MVDFNEKKYSIYAHVVPNGKRYIGKTSTVAAQRWANGNGYKYNDAFFADIQKYGWENIQHIILEIVSGDEKAAETEKKYIQQFKTFDPEFGYNKTTGGDDKFTVRDETRWKQHIARENYFRKPGTKEMKSRSQKEVMEREGVRERISVSLKKYYANEEKEHKEERIKKMSDGQKKYYATHAEEVREKRSKALKERWERPGYRENISRKLTGIKRSEEHKKKISDFHSVAVRCIETGIVYRSCQEAANSIGVHKACMNDVLHGRQKTSGGFHWEYAR